MGLTLNPFCYRPKVPRGFYLTDERNNEPFLILGFKLPGKDLIRGLIHVKSYHKCGREGRFLRGQKEKD